MGSVGAIVRVRLATRILTSGAEEAHAQAPRIDPKPVEEDTMRIRSAGPRLATSALAVAVLAATAAAADPVTDWDTLACELVSTAAVPAPLENRALAIVATAVYEATNAITGRYPGSRLQPQLRDASVAAAVAAANRVTLTTLLPARAATVEDAYRAALAAIPDGEPRAAGVTIGEIAARAVLAMCAHDGSDADSRYRPFTAPGVYVPTVLPAVPQWPQRTPWNLSSASQLRPGPPPGLTTALWARDYDEIKAVGAKTSELRTAEQTEIARFWTSTSAKLYHGVVHSVVDQPGREVTQNARLIAAAAQAIDDALIAVFDAKYAYNFWRPVTAIRNGDLDGNSATERDPSWLPFIDTPLHPEYPCAHCIVSAAVGTVLQAEIGAGPMPMLTTASPSAGGATRSWARVEDFMAEVANARVWDGVHYRNSTEVGTAMGKQVGALTAAKMLQAGPTRVAAAVP